MADAVTTQKIFDGSKKAIFKFTNISDGTGESAVTKLDISTLVGSPEKVKIIHIWYTTEGMSVQLWWDATTNVPAYFLGSNKSTKIDFHWFGGLVNNAGTGVTGDLLLTTVGHTAGDSYSIIIEVDKT